MDEREVIARRLLGNRRYGALRGAHPQTCVLDVLGRALAEHFLVPVRRRTPRDWSQEVRAARRGVERTLDAALRDGPK